APAYLLDVNGNARVTGIMGIGIAPDPLYALKINGNGLASGGSWISDQLFKTNIDSLHNASATIHQLKPRSYFFDTVNVYGINFSNKKQYGFIAQDVETILPELVITTTNPADLDTLGNIVHPAVTYKALNYNAFFGILTKGIQEQSNEIDSLKTKTTNQDSVNTALSNQIDSLTQGLLAGKTKANNQDSIITLLQNQLNQLASMINHCCNNNGNHGNHGNNLIPSGTNNYKSISPTTLTDVELSNKNAIVLNQNVPNPFAEQTTISYFLPDNISRAQILFFEQSGKIIKTIDLTEKGKGQLNVFANDLSSGIYTYSLIVDGQTTETKKMVKTK
ncbi:MAG: tail fiber domain-containing protein, partial [Bacteroidetes bacterium]|nr:tail fiber domain-containing protein [Bacteroidota bacterium]